MKAARSGAGGGEWWRRASVVALLVLHGTLCWLARPTGYLTGQDDIEYMTLGQSLRHGGYNELYHVGAPVHAQYPPGYPALIAVWGGAFGDGFDALAVLSVLMSVAALGFTWAATRRVFGEDIALTSLLLLAVNPALVSAGGNVASEASFTAMTMCVLLLAARGRRSGGGIGLGGRGDGGPALSGTEGRGGGAPGAGTLSAIGGLAILAALTRSIGVVLLGAVLLNWLIERRWKAAALFAGASVLIVGAWFLWTAAAPAKYVGASYVADLRVAVAPGLTGFRLPRRVLRTTLYYLTDAGPWMIGMPNIAGTPIDNLIVVALLSAGLVVGYVQLFRRWRPAALLLLLQLGLLAVWSWYTARFLIPVVPLLVPTVLAGLSVTAVRVFGGTGRRARWAVALPALAAVLELAGSAQRTAAAVKVESGCHEWTGQPPPACMAGGRANYFEAVRYIRENVSREDVFLVAKSGALWFYAGNRSVIYQNAIDPPEGDLATWLSALDVDWVLLADTERTERVVLAPLIEAQCEQYRLVRSFGDNTLLLKPPTDGESTVPFNACEALHRYDEAAVAGTDRE